MAYLLKSISILLFLCFFVGCTKKTEEEVKWDENWAFINSFSFPNSTKKTDYYFKGLVNGQPFNFAVDDSSCVTDFVGRGITYSPSNLITGSQNTLYLGRTARFLGQPILKSPTNFEFDLNFSVANTQRASDSLLRLFLEKKINPFFTKGVFGIAQNSDSLGFRLGILIWKIDGIGVGAETGAFGDQTGSKIVFKEVIKLPGLYEDYFDIILSLNCKLYYPNDAGLPLLFKTIKDGEMRFRIILPHY